MLALVIGNKNLSSWSLRPWLVLKHFGLEFREVSLELDTPQFRDLISRYSGALRVPVLVDGDLHIWDSLAIVEYLNEQLRGRAWPADRARRAHARAISAEMHSGFAALRQNWPMKVVGTAAAKVELPPDGRDDVARIQEIWQDCRTRHANAGPWLFGEYSIADAMYAPVALRFRYYGAQLSNDAAAAYYRQLLQDAHVQAWMRDAEREVSGA